MKNDLKLLKKNIGNLFDKNKKKSKMIKYVDSKVIAPATLQLELDYNRPIVFIFPDLTVVEKFVNNFNIWCSFLDKKIDVLEVREIGDVKHYLPENEVKYIKVLYKIRKGDKNRKNSVYAMTANGCFTPLLPPQNLEKSYMELSVGQEVKLSNLLNKLVDLDYDNEYETSEFCQFSQRGGILDVFSPLHDYPARIEFWGDEIDNIRLYSPETQKTVEKIDKYSIISRDIVGGEEAVSTLLDYFATPPQLVFVYPQQCKENLKTFSNIQMQDRFETNIKMAQNNKNSFFILDPVESALHNNNEHTSSLITQLPIDPSGVLTDEIDFSNRILGVQARVQQIKQWMDFNYNIYLVAGNEKEKEFIEEWCVEYDLDIKKTKIVTGSFISGFILPKEKIVVLTEKELLCLPPKRTLLSKTGRKKINFESVSETKYTDFSIGDYVVHISYGVGIYHGIKEIKTTGCVKEVIEIEYEDEMKLFVPTWQANFVSRYVGSRKMLPKLNKIGGTRWDKEKLSALRGAREMAAEMLRIQAFRAASEGIEFGKDDREQDFFEAAFPFTETNDQLRACDEVKNDMMSPRPMDRLVCGDVGYGKTEVAMRAAFKAVMNGKQVAVLVPTTILAQQHFYSFTERFAEFPIIIEMLSRFKTKGQQKEIIERVKAGSVDIIIGTHRLVQGDVNFNDLGLVIVDEEQRFGVSHKEKLKKLRATVDILTMTATPIPRTLYMAMSGVRDFSTIMTPPVDRMPIQTMVCQFSDEIIKNAINREKRRGGQIFFLHNRVKSIKARYEHLKEILPHISFSVAHGQMGESELEEVMTLFIHGKIDVLICTTIIESGLDIPNTNTIIIERADRFGLAELYQLRGRVGRWTRQAYAYLMLPEHNVMTGKARERLSAIRRYSQLGVGFKLAIKDLEIRGAGSILGAKQSGHINAIGFDLYCQLLKDAVSSLKGKKEINYLPSVDISLDFLEFGTDVQEGKISACLVEEYIPSEILRIDFYRRISSAVSLNDIKEIREELIDRFGKLNKNAENFLFVMEIKLRIALAGYTSLSFNNNHLFIEGTGKNIFLVNGKIPKINSKSSRDKLTEIYRYSKKLLEVD